MISSKLGSIASSSYTSVTNFTNAGNVNDKLSGFLDSFKKSNIVGNKRYVVLDLDTDPTSLGDLISKIVNTGNTYVLSSS